MRTDTRLSLVLWRAWDGATTNVHVHIHMYTHTHTHMHTHVHVHADTSPGEVVVQYGEMTLTREDPQLRGPSPERTFTREDPHKGGRIETHQVRSHIQDPQLSHGCQDLLCLVMPYCTPLCSSL